MLNCPPLIRLEILHMLRTSLVPLTQNVDLPELTPLLLQQGVVTLGCRGVCTGEGLLYHIC